MERAPDLCPGGEQRLGSGAFQPVPGGQPNRSNLPIQPGVEVNRASAHLSPARGLTPNKPQCARRERADLLPRPGRPAALARARRGPLSRPAAVDLGREPRCRGLPGRGVCMCPVRFDCRARGRCSSAPMVICATREGLAIEVEHRSRSSPETRWRSIALHAVAVDGLGPHARASCQTGGRFEEVLFCQILEMRGSQASEASPGGRPRQAFPRNARSRPPRGPVGSRGRDDRARPGDARGTGEDQRPARLSRPCDRRPGIPPDARPLRGHKIAHVTRHAIPVHPLRNLPQSDVQ